MGMSILIIIPTKNGKTSNQNELDEKIHTIFKPSYLAI